MSKRNRRDLEQTPLQVRIKAMVAWDDAIGKDKTELAAARYETAEATELGLAIMNRKKSIEARIIKAEASKLAVYLAAEFDVPMSQHPEIISYILHSLATAWGLGKRFTDQLQENQNVQRDTDTPLLSAQASGINEGE